MYQPKHFEESDRVAMAALLHGCPLGLLISLGPAGLVANAIPFILDQEAGERGVFRCPVSKANTQWSQIGTGSEVLVVFQGAQHYVHPGWYETKRETGKVVPTWNYAMVQVRGHARAIADGAWLSRQIRDLTDMMEGRYPTPWSVDDAPVPYIDAQLRGIIGIEISITSMTGKWKVSQNRSEPDRSGVIAGLRSRADGDAAVMADLVAGHRGS